MRFGFHISISGGFRKVIPQALDLQCQTIQLFSRNPRGWRYRPLDHHDTRAFVQEAKEHDIQPVFVHMPYLVNLASPDRRLFERSVSSLVQGLRRSARICAPFLIMHVGSSPEPEPGMKRMIKGIDRALQKVPNEVILLLENTAGGGSELGHDFRQLRKILRGVRHRKRIGIVLDTAHTFAAGYDLRTRDAVNRTISEFDRIVGLKRLFLIHLNDSRTGCGSHRDQHWHIAKGTIGQGMSHILQHPALQHLPFIMETPRKSPKDDRMNMKMARELAGRL